MEEILGWPVGILSPQPVLHELGNYKDICHMLIYAYSKPAQGARLCIFLLLFRKETHMLPYHHYHPPHTHTRTHSLCKGQRAYLGLLQTQEGLIFLLPPAAFALEEVNSPFFLPPGPAPQQAPTVQGTKSQDA